MFDSLVWQLLIARAAASSPINAHVPDVDLAVIGSGL